MEGISLFVLAIIVLVAYLVVAHFTGKIAEQKGHGYSNFFIFSLFLPLFALLIAGFLGENKAVTRTQSLGEVGNKMCPFCAEVIKSEAVFCRFCNKELTNKVSSTKDQNQNSSLGRKAIIKKQKIQLRAEEAKKAITKKYK